MSDNTVKSATEAQVEAMVDQLHDTAARIDAAFDLKGYKPREWKRSLGSLRSPAHKLSTKVIVEMPRLTRKVQREWQSATNRHLKSQYDQWIGQLTTMLERLKPSR